MREKRRISVLPGDPGDCAGGRAKTDWLGRGNEAVRLFANEKDWRESLAVRPESQVEGEAADQRHDDIGNLGRYAGQIDDRQRLAVYGNPHQPAYGA